MPWKEFNLIGGTAADISTYFNEDVDLENEYETMIAQNRIEISRHFGIIVLNRFKDKM